MHQTILKRTTAASQADKILALLCIILLFSSLIKILGDETLPKSNDSSLPNNNIPEKKLPAIKDFILSSLIMVIYVSLPKEYFLDSDPQRKEEMSRSHISIVFLILKSVS